MPPGGVLLLCELQRLTQRLGPLLVGLHHHAVALELAALPLDHSHGGGELLATSVPLVLDACKCRGHALSRDLGQLEQALQPLLGSRWVRLW